MPATSNTDSSIVVKPSSQLSQAVREMERRALEDHEHLLALDDPYMVAHRIACRQQERGATGAVIFAMKYYARFIRLTAARPRCHQDALVIIGRRVFRVTITEMRSAIKAEAAQKTVRA